MIKKNSAKTAGNQFQNSRPMRRRKKIKQPKGHPTDAELIAAWQGSVSKCPDGRAMGSLKSSDFGLTG